MALKFSELPEHVKKLVREADAARPSKAKAPSSPAPKRPWSNARATEVDGIRFPSKMEAAVFTRLRDELQPGERLYRQVRFPLLAVAPNDKGVPLAMTVDFVIVSPTGWRAIDAKPKRRKSRDWVRGKAAFEATYNVKVEEVDR